MTQNLRRVLFEISDFLPSVVSSREYPKYEGFSADRKRMGGDWYKVGSDLRQALKNERTLKVKVITRKHGQSNNSQSQKR